LVTLELHQQGHSPKAIAAQRGLRVGTLYRHLIQLVVAGAAVDLDALVPPDRQQTIAQLGPTALKPLREYLGADFGYNEIRSVVAKQQGVTTAAE